MMPETPTQQEAASSPAMAARQRRFFITLLVISGLLLTLLLLPVMIRMQTISWLEDHGIEHADIEDIDLNLFNGSFSLTGLKAGDGLQIGLAAVDIDLWPLIRHGLSVDVLHLENIQLHLRQNEQGQWHVKGLHLPDSNSAEAAREDNESEAWLISLNDIELRNIQLDIQGKEISANIPLQTFTLKQLRTTDAIQTLKAAIHLNPVQATTHGYQLQSNGLALNTLIDLPMASDQWDHTHLYQAALALSGTHILHQGEPLLDWLQIRLDGIEAEGTQHLGIASMSLRKLQADKALTQIGKVSADDIKLQELKVRQLNDISLGSLEVRAFQGDQLMHSSQLSIDKLFAKGFHLDKMHDLQLASAGANKLTAYGISPRLKQLHLDRFSVSALEMRDQQQLNFDGMDLSGIGLPATKQHSLGRIDHISLTQGQLTLPDALHLHALSIQGMDVSLIKSKQGLMVFDALKASLPNSQQTASPPATPRPKTSTAQNPRVRIDKFSIAPGSRLAFQDQSVSPVFSSTVAVESFNLTPLDLSGKEAGKLLASFKVGDQGSFTANGDITPAASAPQADLRLALKRLNMAGLSGYVEEQFGNAIQTGQLDINSSIKVADNTIEASNHLEIRKLELGAAKQPGKASQQLGMPLDMALDMLRDDRGDIAFDVPITGKLDDPNINVNDAINQALTSAIGSAALSYASLLLQPYGSILPALNFVGDLISDARKPRLSPVLFEHQSTSLSAPAKDYSEKIALLLKQKTDFRLKLCGLATNKEALPENPEKHPRAKPKSAQALLDLAKARSTAITGVLVNQGIAAERIYDCRPDIDSKKEALPRVELILD